MINIETIFNNAIESWRKNSGIGTMICPLPLNDKVPILLILQRLYNKSPTSKVLIITNNFDSRTDLLSFLTHQEDEENNKEFKNVVESKALRILTADFINSGKYLYGRSILCILYNLDSLTDYVKQAFSYCKFRLIVNNRFTFNQDDRGYLSNICPTLPEFKQAEIDELRTSLPVEEMWVGVTIPEDTEDYKLLEYYNKEITTTLNIFDNFDNINRARIGDSNLNMSASEFCTRIAMENGWNDHLDMNYSYNQIIDDTYNPNILHERATDCFEHIRNRSKLLSDYNGKLEEIYKICKEHENEKILIINKKGEFASKVTSYLNNMFDDIVCGDYHNKIDNVILKNPDGTPVLVKSGVNKGKPKKIGYQAQMTLNQSLFNKGDINILSMSNAPNKDLSVAFNIIIITSPQCDDIKSYLYRLSKIICLDDKIKLYTVYCRNTMEHKQLLNKNVENNHKIVNKDENVEISKNNLDFIIVD